MINQLLRDHPRILMQRAGQLHRHIRRKISVLFIFRNLNNDLLIFQCQIECILNTLFNGFL